MIRYSKGLRQVVAAAAESLVLYGIKTEFVGELSAQQTRLQKAIRQHVRKMLSKTDPK